MDSDQSVKVITNFWRSNRLERNVAKLCHRDINKNTCTSFSQKTMPEHAEASVYLNTFTRHRQHGSLIRLPILFRLALTNIVRNTPHIGVHKIPTIILVSYSIYLFICSTKSCNFSAFILFSDFLLWSLSSTICCSILKVVQCRAQCMLL